MTARRQIKRIIIIALSTLIIGLIARETFNFREVAVSIMLENVELPDMIDESNLIVRSHLEKRSGTDRYISDSGELAVDSLWGSEWIKY